MKKESSREKLRLQYLFKRGIIIRVAVLLWVYFHFNIKGKRIRLQFLHTVNAEASYVAPVQTYAPVVVGYTSERRGLFGRRSVYRPVVSPAVSQPIAVVTPVETIAQATAIAPAPVTAARPILQTRAVYQAPVTTAPVVVSQRVVASGPVTSGSGPVIMARPVIGSPAPVIMTPAPVFTGRPLLAPAVVNRPVIVTPPAVTNSYYPLVYPTTFAPVVGY